MSALKRKELCEYCEKSKIPGILIPTEFDDREPPRDGKVFVARCDTCELYDSDISAAEALSKLTGWPVLKSYDRDDEVDPKGREEKQGTDYYRPYFACRLADALALDDQSTYRIIRYYRDSAHPDHRKVIETGLTLEEAKAHCNRKDTQEKGVWFDGFEEE